MGIRIKEAPSGKEITGTVDNQILVWNNTTKRWDVGTQSGGGAISAIPNTFWVQAASTKTGGTAAISGAAGPFPTIAAALAAAVVGHAVTLFVGEGDYSAEGFQDFSAFNALNVYGIAGSSGSTEQGGQITLPALSCPNMVLRDVTLSGAGNTQADQLEASNCSLTTAGLTVSGYAALANCVLGHDISIAAGRFDQCSFDSTVGTITDISGWDVDQKTLGQLGNGGAAGKFSGGQVSLNGVPLANMYDNNTTVVVADFSGVLITNFPWTAPRTLTLDLTGAIDGDVCHLYTYADVAGAQGPLTVNPGGLTFSRDTYETTLVVTTGGTALAVQAAEHAPSP